MSLWEKHLIVYYLEDFKKLSFYYSAITRNVTESFAEMWMHLETVIQSEESQTEKYKYRVLTDVWNLETRYRLSHLQNRNRDTDIEEEVGRMGNLRLTYKHC